jgi:hypothetical protein
VVPRIGAKDTSLLNIAAGGADKGVPLEARNRYGVVFSYLLQAHLRAARKASHQLLVQKVVAL